MRKSLVGKLLVILVLFFGGSFFSFWLTEVLFERLLENVQESDSLYLNTLITLIIMVFGVGMLVKRRGLFENSKCGKFRFFGLPLGLILAFVSFYVSKILGLVEFSFHFLGTINIISLTVVVLSMIPSVLLEELLFRKLLIEYFETMDWKGVVISAILFGLAHNMFSYGISYCVYIITMAMMFSTLYIAFDSLWVPVLTHLGFNIVTQVFEVENIFGLDLYDNGHALLTMTQSSFVGTNFIFTLVFVLFSSVIYRRFVV